MYLLESVPGQLAGCLFKKLIDYQHVVNFLILFCITACSWSHRPNLRMIHKRIYLKKTVWFLVILLRNPWWRHVWLGNVVEISVDLASGLRNTLWRIMRRLVYPVYACFFGGWLFLIHQIRWLLLVIWSTLIN